jgi:hypothetical protein
LAAGFGTAGCVALFEVAAGRAATAGFDVSAAMELDVGAVLFVGSGGLREGALIGALSASSFSAVAGAGKA